MGTAGKGQPRPIGLLAFSAASGLLCWRAPETGWISLNAMLTQNLADRVLRYRQMLGKHQLIYSPLPSDDLNGATLDPDGWRSAKVGDTHSHSRFEKLAGRGIDPTQRAVLASNIISRLRSVRPNSKQATPSIDTSWRCPVSGSEIAVRHRIRLAEPRLSRLLNRC